MYDQTTITHEKGQKLKSNVWPLYLMILITIINYTVYLSTDI